MKRTVAAFFAGLLFAVGLALAGMTQPSKVIGFLNITGDWDPSLALVMGGAIAVHLGLYRFILKRDSPLFEERFRIPTRRDIDGRLVIGAALFGLGWGFGGYCPGPALASVGTATLRPVVFVAVMLTSMFVFRKVDEALRKKAAPKISPEAAAATAAREQAEAKARASR